MWTTGLVSLSIHEALTFEGVEIALNPDLFNDHSPPRQNLLGRSLGNSSIASSAIQKPHHQRAVSLSDSIPIAALPSDDSRIDEGKPPIQNSASFSTANSLSNRRLEVGDFIEIRVWDPLPGSTKNSPKALKRRSPPASKAASRGGSGSNSVTTESLPVRKKLSTSATLEAAVSTLRKTTASSSGSLQYSIDSSFPNFEKEEEPPKEGDTSTVSSVEHTKESVALITDPPSPNGNVPNTVTATSDENRAGMPPTFPRNRADTADGNSRLQASKPLPVQRTRTNVNAPVDTSERRRQPSSSANTVTARPTGLHVRDISDMTMDTILGSHIISDIGETGDDGEEDDTLSRISSTHTLRLSFVMLVTEGTLNSLNVSARTQVSMLRQGK